MLWSPYVRNVFWFVTLAWRKCNPWGTVKSTKAKPEPAISFRQSESTWSVFQNDLFQCLGGVHACGRVWRCVHFLTSSLRSDPGLCMNHRIWACWDLGTHSRKVELLCTPKSTRSSTRPPPRPKENKAVIDPRAFCGSKKVCHAGFQWWLFQWFIYLQTKRKTTFLQKGTKSTYCPLCPSTDWQGHHAWCPVSWLAWKINHKIF